MIYTEEQRKALLARAREAIANRLEKNRIFPENTGTPGDPELLKVRAVFVTLRIGGRLRGCIGSLEARESLWQNVWRMAQQAAFSDPRFPQLSSAELPDVVLEISVLSPFQDATISGIVPGTHGVLIEKAGRSAVFLPQVAPEQGWDRETLLSELCRKAGLPRDAWKADAKLSSFTAEVFGEQE
ncbi:MAG: AmmeMemoRadiSam system protein A [Spirochaetota bacterium]|jgi:AmmeMemoRadiSam system protein A|nr:AmmeMemoRadiSam system protein A [Spirochaetota bacterium]